LSSFHSIPRSRHISHSLSHSIVTIPIAVAAALLDSPLERTMNSLEVTPGKAVGDFVLGCTIGEVVKLIRSRNKEIPEARLLCHKDNLLSLDIVIDIRTMLMRFDPITQRLKMIEVYDLDKVSLSYDDNEFWYAKGHNP
jgi:hypothetical protein